jgi:cellulose synthase/poly-beta-1,6-N-acetylglucosamine synthase-like glycosyltransferase
MIVISIAFFLYVCLVIMLIGGWRMAVTNAEEVSRNAAETPMVSVIVAARNENGVINHLLTDLAAQVYSPFEVIVVDDHSDDEMASSVANIVKTDARFGLLNAVGHGKKRAITRGVQAARGSIIMTTDADCRVGPQWISEMALHFYNGQTQFVFGGVTMEAETFFAHVQSIEFATLIATGAATAAIGHPTMCNGANLAFRKAAFNDVDGFSGNENVPSGDDEFLMRKIMARHLNGVKFAAGTQTVVRTKANDDLISLFHQRIRWAGKWRHQTNALTRLLAIFIFSFHVVTTALVPMVCMNVIPLSLAGLLLLVKGIIELIFLRSATPFLKVTWRWNAFFMLQLLYSPYVIIIAVLSNFSGYVWKGRKVKALTISSN